MPLELARLVEATRERAIDRRRSFAWDPCGEGRRAGAPTVCPRPLRVLLADGERTLFDYLADPRLEISTHDPHDASPAIPDLVVLNRADRMRFEETAAELPAQAWSWIAEGRTRLVFDASAEGHWPTAPLIRRLHEFLAARGVRPSMAAWVTQDRGFAEAYEACCAEHRLGPERMRVWLHDFYIQRIFAEIAGEGEAMFERRLERYARRSRLRPRRFVCLNRTLRPAKTLLLLRLMNEGLWDAGFISSGRLGQISGGRIESREGVERRLRTEPGFESLYPELAPWLDRLEALGPVEIGGEADAPHADSKRSLRPVDLAEYDLSWFSIVAETHTSGWLHRITEKPMKPLLNFHPFLLLGCVGALKLVRAYGFDTFAGVLDESYDEDLEARGRHETVFRETRRLCALGEAELATFEAEAAGAAVFNAWWGLVELPKLFATHIDASLVDQLADFCAPTPAA